MGSVQVVDGDSLRRGDTDIRLHGIDAPEYRQSCRDKHGAEYSCGKQAANALRRLVKGGRFPAARLKRTVTAAPLRFARVGDLEINGEMVRLGWAVAYSRHSLSYVRAGGRGEAAKRGIWAGKL